MKSENVKKIIEFSIHFILVVVVPLVYLEIKTGFNKYRLPEQMIYVYGYWIAYIIGTIIYYSLKRKNKRYKHPDCTKKYENL